VSRKQSRVPGLLLVTALLGAPALSFAWTPLPVASDALVRAPGTQPEQLVNLTSPDTCFQCHIGYDPNVEPGFAWHGSNMAQAARDPFFWAGLTVAAQDSIYAFARPNAADTCERCHLPRGWLEGRSDPVNGSMMTGFDFDGVQCDLCHRMVDPFFADTFAGTREGNDWAGYWDESNLSSLPSQASAMTTRTNDAIETGATSLFNGSPLYDAAAHLAPGFTENASGQYIVAGDTRARGPFSDGATPHGKLYSRYHKSKFFCSTCHDVSNTPLANASFAGLAPGDGVTVLPSEAQPAHGYFPLERTFSEFMLSDYGLPGGAPGTGPFAGQTIGSCQDCHMPERVGPGCNFPGTAIRPTDSVEHPNSGVLLHDLTGGNALLPYLLASTVPGSPTCDTENASLLGQGPATLTLDMTAGLPLDARALTAAGNRTVASLRRAASIQMLAYDPASGAASFRIQNHTGHKLISGYPEGRRMFVTVRLYKAKALVHQRNPYDAGAGTLRGLPAAYSPNSPPLGPGEVYDDALVYEAHPQSAITGEAQTFHFVLATGFHKDNRIPPRGFRVGEASARLAEPAWAGAAAPGYFTASEYAGGFDDVSLTLPAGGDAMEIALYYQATSREYVEFLRDEIQGSGTSLASPTPSGEPKAYIAQTDAFFGGLRAWGDTIWQLWQHNKDVPGAAPILMAGAKLALDTCAGEPDGTPCDDGDACTAPDACAAGACKGGAMIACDDGDGCTDDGCDPAMGCVHSFNAAPCDDGDLCSSPDVCAFGVCVPGPPVDCNDKDGCTLDSCDPTLGCVFKPLSGPGCSDAGVDASTSSSASSASSSASSAASSGAGGMGGAEPASSSSGGGGAGSGGGCGCVVAGDQADGRLGALLAALAMVAARRRTRRRQHEYSEQTSKAYSTATGRERMPGGAGVSRSWRRRYMEALRQDLETSLPPGIRSLPVAVLFVRTNRKPL
jgi:MYXO-CTERM domain-containing protein